MSYNKFTLVYSLFGFKPTFLDFRPLSLSRALIYPQNIFQNPVNKISHRLVIVSTPLSTSVSNPLPNSFNILCYYHFLNYCQWQYNLIDNQVNRNLSHGKNPYFSHIRLLNFDSKIIQRISQKNNFNLDLICRPDARSAAEQRFALLAYASYTIILIISNCALCY